ncbi:Uncharacterized membrane protein YadS [Desulfacinum hydrothermale DSM 13146]|uniref:Uncharacterized membrane protein YadS n=1 Tax=Desulfacinum hydrothermale DSM 13146 TaxID=1121390 RepID=A0A1W1X9B1_9BACT|nr:putative sulfate exporter family transporter [Desulfacinum hydrothermale]SMC20595.1 Uncharacterized membrane protein YadS [Desulfacinum hydrothermale DSM 13146]
MTQDQRRWYTGMLTQEDWWAVWLGLAFFFLSLVNIAGIDLVGWITYPTSWVFSPEGKKGAISGAFYALGKKYSVTAKDFYAGLGWWSVIWTYVIFTIATCIGAACMKWNLKRFFAGWTIIYFLTIACWFVGHHAFITANKMKMHKYGLNFALSLGGGGSFILALIVGLIIGNFFKGFAEFLTEAAKPEWYIKTAIVTLGVKLGYLPIKMSSMSQHLGKQAAGLTFDLFLAGCMATIVAYMIFWPGVYIIARKIFKLPRKTAAVLGSGISICGVSAAVATGGAVRARPVVSIMVSALVVVWAVIELVVLPGLFTHVWPTTNDPLVAGAAMGMSVKTDGADAAAGELMDELMRNKIEADSNGKVQWPSGIITSSAVMTKVWIDMFIGIWAFVLAMVWVYKIDRVPGETVPASEVWHRFPKFVLGYFFCWLFLLAIYFGPGKSGAPEAMPFLKSVKAGAVPIEKGMRKLFFMLTFLSLGVITDFQKLREAQFGKMVWVYFVALFLFIVPVAAIIAYLFHHGMQIPNIAQYAKP